MSTKTKKKNYTIAEVRTSLSKYIAVSTEQLRKELRERWRMQAKEELKQRHVRS